jgi:hypothetical protein
LPERKPHRRNLLLLIDDDLLCDATKSLIVAVTQLGERHVDGTLVVRLHHRDEVGVDVA